jgi:hypothetical protein
MAMKITQGKNQILKLMEGLTFSVGLESYGWVEWSIVPHSGITCGIVLGLFRHLFTRGSIDVGLH